MKMTILCPLLLATVTLVSGEGGGVSLFNNATFGSRIYASYADASAQQLKFDRSPIINAGETKTTGFPEGFEDYEISVYTLSARNTPLKSLFWAHDMSKPITMCFKTWGTVKNPEIGQTDCNSRAAHALLPGDGAAISVTNSATYRSEINLKYGLRDAQGKKKQHKEAPTPINPGETKTVAIPKGAEEIEFNIVHPKTNSEFLFTAKFSRPAKLCLKIWGTAEDPKFSQIDC